MIKKGDILGGTYQILDELGKGGIGIVYYGYHLRLQKKIVIKKIKDNFVGRLNERGEVDLLKNLHHMFLPQVYDFLQIDDQIFTVMDFIDGKSMDFYLQEHYRFPEKQVLLWMNQLCDVLSYLHSQTPPIIHSDIKPANIMVKPDGNICLIDFNVSFGEDNLKGISGYTERYAAPEQLLKHQLYMLKKDYRSIVVDTRSDIYSLGVTLYHIVTGIKPPNDYRVITPLENLDLGYSDNLLNIIQKAMEPGMEKRYQSIDDMKYALINIKKNDAAYRKTVFRQRILGLLGVCMAGAGAVVAFMGYQTLLRESFTEEYEELVTVSSTYDYDAVISQGMDILNNGKYQNAMKEEGEKKADIFYMIANSYFEQEDYPNAVYYYSEAVRFNQTNPEYFRDYAIALARDNNLTNAKEVLNEAISLGLEEDHICLVKAEIALAEEDGESAVQWFEKAISITENGYLRSRAYILCGRAYRQLGDNQGEIRILEEAKNHVEADKIPVVTRALGAAYMRCVNLTSDDSERNGYIVRSAECYGIVANSTQCTFTDQMNLAICYEMLGDYESEQGILDGMEAAYPDDYRVYMRKALMYFAGESEKEESVRDYRNVQECFEKALVYYERVRNTGASDENMQYLETVVSELKTKGWLN